MAEEARFNVVFDGLIVIDKPEQEVKENLARLFKCDLARIEGLFADRTVVIKRELSEAAANRYIKALLDAGAIARKENANSGPPKPTIPPAPATPQPEEITARMQEEGDGFVDLFFAITNVNKKGDSHFFEVRGLHQGKPVGFRLAVTSKMPAGIVNGQPTRDGFVREGARLRAKGEESDRFVHVLGELYGFPTDQRFTANVVKTTVYSMNDAPVDLDVPGQYKFKLFFEEGNEALYSELFLNIDTKNKRIEIREKDMAYRKPLIQTLIKAPDPALVSVAPRAQEGVEERGYVPPTRQAMEALEAERKEEPEYCDLEIFSVDGRLGRVRYAGWLMAVILLLIPVAVFVGFVVAFLPPLGMLLVVAVGGAFLVADVVLTIRRLHDADMPGWLAVLIFIPVIAGFFTLFLLLKPGDDLTNDYGPPPPPNSTGVTVLAGLFVFTVISGTIAMLTAR
ncbi:MAG: DUF805 domain-containing protein [Zoogloeaceae bacterium]|jgi:uncharacterized membrane protein YhaH (DUF805 family)|nr:DUF805 domain-containing protein [Zoogloeaceae bacterium]